MTQIRLHKYLAQCGVVSRRKAEDLMRAGLVRVNDRPALKPGLQIDPDTDRVTVRGRTVRPQPGVYLALHKPRGTMTTAHDERGRKTVLDLVPGVSARIYPAGRLDRDTEGLLVLTNDGALTHYLTHPGCGVTKVYRATVEGFVTDEALATLREGVRLAGRKVVPRRARIVHRNPARSRLEIEVAEGLNREVRRMLAAVGHEARRLVRTRVGPLALKGIPRGRARRLTRAELRALAEGMAEHGLSLGGPAPARADRGGESRRGRSTRGARNPRSGPQKHGPRGRAKQSKRRPPRRRT